jgi:palmitoyl-protein thioesterase
LLPDFLNDLAPELIYTEFVQNLIGAAAYWRDPYNLDLFKQFSSSLASLDNFGRNETKRNNFLGLEKLVMFGSPKDGAICPWNSAWFGGFVENDEKIVEMEEREEFQKDLFGLKTLFEAGKVFRFDSGLEHAQNMNSEELIKKAAPFLKD